MLLISRACHKMWIEYLLSVNEFSLAMNFLLSFSLRSQNCSWTGIFFLSSKRKSGISFSFASFCLLTKFMGEPSAPPYIRACAFYYLYAY